MADDPNRVSLTADELKALELIISVAQSQGVNPAENLAFITSIVPAIVNVVKNIAPVVQKVAPVVVPVLQQVTPLVAAGAMAASHQAQYGGQGVPPNVTLNDLIELRRRANLS